MSWIVYCHTHIESGRCYVGVTSQTMKKRWNQHIAKSKSSKGGRWHFPNAIRKYGKDAFEPLILQQCPTLEIANAYEDYYIDLFRTRDPERGFNLAKGGEHKPHPIRKNPWNNLEYREKQALIPKFWKTPQAKANHKAAVRTPEYREKRSIISKEVTSRPEVKAKISAAAKKQVLSPERRAKMVASKSHVVSIKTREKISKKSRRYTTENDSIIHKICRVHGILAIGEFRVIRRKNRNSKEVVCKECVNSKRRTHSKS